MAADAAAGHGNAAIKLHQVIQPHTQVKLLAAWAAASQCCVRHASHAAPAASRHRLQLTYGVATAIADDDVDVLRPHDEVGGRVDLGDVAFTPHLAGQVQERVVRRTCVRISDAGNPTH